MESWSSFEQDDMPEESNNQYEETDDVSIIDNEDEAWESHYKRYLLGKIIQGPISKKRLIDLYDHYVASHKPAPEPQQVLHVWSETMKQLRINCAVNSPITRYSKVAIESFLDNDMLVFLMTFLQPRDLLSLAQTSQKFRSLSLNPWIWRQIYKSKTGKSAQVVDYRTLCLSSVFLNLSISRSSYLDKERTVQITSAMHLNSTVRTLKTMICGFVQSGCPSSSQVIMSVQPNRSSSNLWIDLDHLPSKVTLKQMRFMPGEQRVYVFVSKRREPEPLPDWLQQELVACGFQQPVVSAN